MSIEVAALNDAGSVSVARRGLQVASLLRGVELALLPRCEQRMLRRAVRRKVAGR